MEFFHETHIHFTGKMKAAVILSLALIAVSIVSLVAHGGPRYGVDFRGGTILQVAISPMPATGDVREALAKGGFDGAEVQMFGEDAFLIAVPQVEDSAGLEVAESMKSALAANLPGATVVMQRQETVGPKIGSELRTAAVNSIFAALVLVLIYIAVRFVFRYGVAAILALAHDVILTVGLFSILDKEISLQIIAALLTIVGYSINDKIVVFDRIRENMRMRRREGYREVIDRSLNETLSRTLLTGGTTLIVCIVLYIMGGPVIRDFALALTFGIVIGTYSSIFIASPIAIWWTERRLGDRKRQPAM